MVACYESWRPLGNLLGTPTPPGWGVPTNSPSRPLLPGAGCGWASVRCPDLYRPNKCRQIWIGRRTGKRWLPMGKDSASGCGLLIMENEHVA